MYLLNPNGEDLEEVVYFILIQQNFFCDDLVLKNSKFLVVNESLCGTLFLKHYFNGLYLLQELFVYRPFFFSYSPFFLYKIYIKAF